MKRRIAVDLSVLRESRNLRLLIIGELFCGLGTQAALVAIPYQIYTLTHSAALVGLLGIVELVPIVIGVAVRRRDRGPDRAAAADVRRADGDRDLGGGAGGDHVRRATRRCSLIFVLRRAAGGAGRRSTT